MENNPEFWKSVLFAEVNFFVKLFKQLIDDGKLTKDELKEYIMTMRECDNYVSIIMAKLDELH